MENDASSTEGLLECYLRGLECFAQERGDLSWKKARERYIQALRTLAVEYPAPQDSIIHYLDDQEVAGFRGGDEHILVDLDLPGKNRGEVVYKITHSDNFGCSVLHDPLDEELTGRHFCARGNENPWFLLEALAVTQLNQQLQNKNRRYFEARKRRWFT